MGIYIDMIDAKLVRLQSVVARMRQTQGEISKLEVDLFLQILRELYEDGLSLADPLADQMAVLSNDSHGDEENCSDVQEKEDLPFAVDDDFVVPESVMSDVEEECNDDLFNGSIDELEEELCLDGESDDNEIVSNESMVEGVVEPQEDKIYLDEVPSEQNPDIQSDHDMEPVSEQEVKISQDSEFVPVPESELETVDSDLVSSEQIDNQLGDVENHVDDGNKDVERSKQPSLFDFITKKGDQGSDLTLGESLKLTNSDTQATIGQKVINRKISDLRDIININDRFNFVNNLFSSNIRAYNECITKLNEISVREEAIAYLTTIAEHYGWNDNSAVVESFYKVIDRKF